MLNAVARLGDCWLFSSRVSSLSLFEKEKEVSDIIRDFLRHGQENQQRVGEKSTSALNISHCAWVKQCLFHLPATVLCQSWPFLFGSITPFSVLFRESNLAFKEALTKLQHTPAARRLPFVSFLLLPMQRVTRMPILLRVRQFSPIEMNFTSCPKGFFFMPASCQQSVQSLAFVFGRPSWNQLRDGLN